MREHPCTVSPETDAAYADGERCGDVMIAVRDSRLDDTAEVFLTYEDARAFAKEILAIVDAKSETSTIRTVDLVTDASDEPTVCNGWLIIPACGGYFGAIVLVNTISAVFVALDGDEDASAIGPDTRDEQTVLRTYEGVDLVVTQRAWFEQIAHLVAMYSERS